MAKQVLGMMPAAGQLAWSAHGYPIRVMTRETASKTSAPRAENPDLVPAEEMLRKTTVLAPLPGPEPATGPPPTFDTTLLEAEAILRQDPPLVRAQTKPGFQPQSSSALEPGEERAAVVNPRNTSWQIQAVSTPTLDLKK
jgi:hypothetical protein